MRFKLKFVLENNFLTLEYKKAILSFIKNALEDYNIEIFNSLYHKKDCIKKTYTFSPNLHKCIISNEGMKLESNKMEITFSAYNSEYGIHLYNAFLKKIDKKYPLYHNTMILKKIEYIKEKEIKNNSMKIKMMSPLVCRNHNRETGKDMYYSYLHGDLFEQTLKINLAEQMKQEGLAVTLLEKFNIQPIQAKKTVVPIYEKKVECSLGYFEVNGDKALLEYIYKAGMGANRGLGFGTVEYIE